MTGRDLDTVTAVVSWADIEDIAASIREEMTGHPPQWTCACPAVEAVARLQELGYTITKAGTDG